MSYFHKYKSLFTTTSSSFATGSDVDITLVSATGLPTTTDIVLTFDRVNSAGVSTPSAMERILGRVSGSSFVVVERGYDGTTDAAHTSPVVEQIWNAADFNDLIDGVLVGVTETGIRKPTAVTSYSPAGAGTTTMNVALGNIHTMTMPADTQTIAISNEAVGQCFMVEIINATSQGALTWFSTIKWVQGTAPTLTGTNGKKDVFGFRVTGADTYDGYIVGQNL